MEHKLSPQNASKSLTRRKFIYLSGLAAGSMALPGCASSKPRTLTSSDKLNVLCVGAGGKGESDISTCMGENIIGICDVDAKQAEASLSRVPSARYYKDWRVMLEKEGKNADAVVISTPDHMHASIAATAIRMKKAVYCQKPLTYSVHEARLLGELTKQYGVVTQMGNQGSSENGIRRAIETIQSGLLGEVRNVHVWSNRPVWPQGMGRPPGQDPIPASLNWDLWLGPADVRPFKKEVYHPFNWRGWQDFGTGALGDMACHTANMPFRALKLEAPTLVEADSSSMNNESYPSESRIRFAFPAREGMPPVDLWWYDGGRKPDAFLLAHVKALMDEVPGSGCLVVGDKGILFSPDDYGARFFVKLWDEEELVLFRQHEGVAAIPETIPRNRFKGNINQRHMDEWIAACKGDGTTYSGFEIASKLTEVILLGCVALKAKEKLDWDGETMRFPNAPDADQFLRRKYRKGWTL